VASHSTSINSLESCKPYVLDTSYEASTHLVFPESTFNFIKPFTYGVAKSYNFVPNNYLFIHTNQYQLMAILADETVPYNAFRCTIQTSPSYGDEFNLYYFIANDPYLSTLTTGKPVCLEILYSYPNILSFIINGKVIVQRLLSSGAKLLLPFVAGSGGYVTPSSGLGSMIIAGYAI
jgi:hypothetical protein